MRAGLVLLFGLLGCQGGEALWLPMPESPTGSATLILFLDDGLTELFGYAEDVTDRFSFPSPMDWESPERLFAYALFYDAALEQLNVPAGPFERKQGSCPLLWPDHYATLERTGDDLSAWTFVQPPVVPERLAQMIVPGDLPCDQFGCTSFEQIEQSMPLPTEVDFILPETATTALIGMSGRLYYGTPDGVRPAFSMPAVQPKSVWRADDGTTWFGGDSGDVTKRLADGTLETVRTATTTGLRIMALVGAQDAPFELFALGVGKTLPNDHRDVRFERFDGRQWEVLYQAQWECASQNRSTIVWLEPGSAVAIFSCPVLVVYDQGRTITLDFEDILGASLLDDHAEAITMTDPFGVVVAVSSGPLLQTRQPRSKWTILPGSEERARGARVLLPLREGLVGVVYNGISTEYLARGPCASFTIPDFNPSTGAVVEDRLIVGGQRDTPGALSKIVWLSSD